jgi:hypothetical protein
MVARNRLVTMYQTLHDNIHARSGQKGPLKLQYMLTEKESVMGWVGFPCRHRGWRRLMQKTHCADHAAVRAVHRHVAIGAEKRRGGCRQFGCTLGEA